jgi:hypothetical protein
LGFRPIVRSGLGIRASNIARKDALTRAVLHVSVLAPGFVDPGWAEKLPLPPKPLKRQDHALSALPRGTDPTRRAPRHERPDAFSARNTWGRAARHVWQGACRPDAGVDALG